ncbi:MAG: PrsW family glutamic-type intramembrane protease [Saprospiraceae bacterium]
MNKNSLNEYSPTHIVGNNSCTLVCFFIIQADKHEREDKIQLLLALLAGALITIPAFYIEAAAHNAGWDDGHDIQKTLLFSFVAIGGVEELFKVLALVFLFYHANFSTNPSMVFLCCDHRQVAGRKSIVCLSFGRLPKSARKSLYSGSRSCQFWNHLRLFRREGKI